MTEKQEEVGVQITKIFTAISLLPFFLLGHNTD